MENLMGIKQSQTNKKSCRIILNNAQSRTRETSIIKRAIMKWGIRLLLLEALVKWNFCSMQHQNKRVEKTNQSFMMLIGCQF